MNRKKFIAGLVALGTALIPLKDDGATHQVRIVLG